MKFSVVIPLYNKEYSIIRCLDSVFSQGGGLHDVVVVNDGSTDDSLSVVKTAYQKEIDSGILTLINKKNEGVSVARNIGMANSKMPFVCFLDADDEWKPDFLSNMHRLITNYPLANLYCLAHTVSKDSNPPVKPKHGLPDDFNGYVDDFFKASAKGSVAKSSKICIKKQALIDIGGFPEGVVAGEDLYVWIMLALNGKVACDMSYSAIVYQEKDESRSSRNNSVPYPFIYLSKNQNIKKTKSLNKYLFVVFYKHFISSLLGFKFKEAGLRLYHYLRIYL